MKKIIAAAVMAASFSYSMAGVVGVPILKKSQYISILDQPYAKTCLANLADLMAKNIKDKTNLEEKKVAVAINTMGFSFKDKHPVCEYATFLARLMNDKTNLLKEPNQDTYHLMVVLDDTLKDMERK